MKKIPTINVWRTIVLLVSVFFFFACSPGDNPGDPTNPTNPTDPNDPFTQFAKPTVGISTAKNVTANSATIAAWVIPNEKDTKISFEYKKSTESNYQSKVFTNTYAGKDTVKLTFDLLDLVANSEYLFRIKASNKGGEVISIDAKFSTWIVKDYDGNIYHVIKIGDQYWLQENLKATHYKNGNAINNQTSGTWDKWSTTGSYSWYNNDANLGKVYGALYNWYAGTDSRGFIAGYHLPTIQEYKTLHTFLGGDDKVGIKLMETGTNHWAGDDIGTNSSGFTALGAGCISEREGFTSRYLKVSNTLMTSTSPRAEQNDEEIFSINLDGTCGFGGFYAYKSEGLSIRLIKD